MMASTGILRGDNSIADQQEGLLTVAAAEEWIQRTCFSTGPAGRIGLELELLMGRVGDPSLQRPFADDNYRRLFSELRHLDVHGSVTLEPGGQLELSSHPEASLQDLIFSVHGSLKLLREQAADLDAILVGAGVSPHLEPRRITQAPRYAAMEQYFEPWAPAGQTMMCSTASVQINVEAGADDVEIRHRWNLLYSIGPVLAATFANSGWIGGRRSGWKSTRLAAWLALDPARTGVPPFSAAQEPGVSYSRWALDAPLMMIRRDAGEWQAPAGLTFRDWLRLGTAVVPDRPPANLEDLQQHLSTLFPHVRPKGYFEIRYIDAQPGCWWAVPAAVVSALISNPAVSDQARGICAGSPDWEAAARLGLADPGIASRAEQLMALAAGQLRLDSSTRAIASQVEEFAEKWTLRGLSPADDDPSVWPDRDQGCALDSGLC
ncbi:hypothetical protein ANMWB30_18490 [Arthrobacter sp. MWB30]|nr:hypothetical protein ANMWB30_18490 [Arthrobacter sp. MWB30]